MNTNPYPAGSRENEHWWNGWRSHNDYPGTRAVDLAWAQGFLAAAGQEHVDSVATHLAAFDAALEALQEEPGDNPWREIATHLLAQIIDLRQVARWQHNNETAAENAIAYCRTNLTYEDDRLDTARRHVDRLPAVFKERP